MAVPPFALSIVLVVALLKPVPRDQAVALAGLILLLALATLLLAVWMTRQIVRPAEELERSRSSAAGNNVALRTDALLDGLTGLGNHRAFQEELLRELEWYNRYKVPVAMLLMDVDDLKVVNDSAGHAAGDELLRQMGRVITEVGRYADRAFRIGGDDFAILMPHTDSAGALELARRLQERANRVTPDGGRVAFSAGISACPALATTHHELYAQAEAALQSSKRHGRGQIDIFDPRRHRPTTHESANDVAAAVSRVVTERLLGPVYQPIVDIATGRVLGFEGLVRPTPESGFADPTSLFAAAETVGRTVEVDQACLETVIAGARALLTDQLLTVNISPRTVEAPQFTPDSLLALLSRYGIRPERVVVEITEREKVEDLGRLRANLGALQRTGIRIAADDVGAGNAGLRLLSQFRFDIVKIDLTLVQDGATRDSSRAVLGSLRDLASRWGASVIAEGVETVNQLRMLSELGLGAGQGYLLGRPAPATQMSRIDIATIAAGGFVLERRPRTIDGAVPATS